MNMEGERVWENDTKILLLHGIDLCVYNTKTEHNTIDILLWARNLNIVYVKSFIKVRMKGVKMKDYRSRERNFNGRKK